jgi:hypothetical protein
MRRMMIWKKLYERHELCFVHFCAGCTHLISLPFTIWQALDNALNYPAACGHNAPWKKSMPVVASGRCALGLNIISRTPSCVSKHLSLTWLSVTWSGLSHRLQVKSETSGMQLRGSWSNSEAHIEDIRRTRHIYFCQPIRWVGLTNSKSTSLCQYTIPRSTKTVYLFYSVRQINLPVAGCDRSQINTATSKKITYFKQ